MYDPRYLKFPLTQKMITNAILYYIMRPKYLFFFGGGEGYIYFDQMIFFVQYLFFSQIISFIIETFPKILYNVINRPPQLEFVLMSKQIQGCILPDFAISNTIN